MSNIVGGERHQNGRREDENIANGDCFPDKQTCANCQHNSYGNTKDSFERDRTLGRSVAITDFTTATSNAQRTNYSSNAPIGAPSNDASKTSDNIPQKENSIPAQSSTVDIAVTNSNDDATESTTSSSGTLYNV